MAFYGLFLWNRMTWTILQWVITPVDPPAELCTTLIRLELADSLTGGFSLGVLYTTTVSVVDLRPAFNQNGGQASFGPFLSAVRVHG